jgi:hypothetical protein
VAIAPVLDAPADGVSTLISSPTAMSRLPPMSSRLRPNRSPSTPQVSSSRATGTRKASEIHVSCEEVVCRSSWNSPLSTAGMASPTWATSTARAVATRVPVLRKGVCTAGRREPVAGVVTVDIGSPGTVQPTDGDTCTVPRCSDRRTSARTRGILARVRLLERDTSLSSLARYADEVGDPDGRLVLVGGEAGVGKTALIEEFERRTPDATWAWGACDGLFTPRPLGPLFDIATALGGELLAAWDAGADREALFAATLRTLGATRGRTVVVLEDLHWADEATLDLLRFLGRRLRGLRVLLLATFRDDGLAPDDPLRAVLGELATERTSRRMALPELSAAGVEEMARGTAVEAAELLRLTGATRST